MLPCMWCPYCGDEMRSGHVRLRGQWLAGPWAGALAVNFEVDDESGEGSELLPRSRFRVLRRAAACCVRCEAVVVEPKLVDPGPEAVSRWPAVPPSDDPPPPDGSAPDGSASDSSTSDSSEPAD